MFRKLTGWVFDGLRLAIYRGSCEACFASRDRQNVLDTIEKMESVFGDEIKLRSELNRWFTGTYLDYDY